MNLIIRKTNTLTKEEQDVIRKMEKESFAKDKLENYSYLSNDINAYKDMPCFYLGYLENELVAFLTTFVPSTQEAEVLAAVHPKYKNKGIFKTLLSETIVELGKKHIDRIIFAVEPKSQDGMMCLKSLPESDLLRSEYRMVMKDQVIDIEKVKQELKEVKNLTVERVTKENVDEYKTITNAAFEEEEDDNEAYVETILSGEGRDGYLMYLGNEAVGTFCLNHEDGDTFIYGVAIKDGLRGKGLGRNLMKFVTALAFGMSDRVVLDVDSENPAAYELYKKIGFVVEFQVDYYLIAREKFTDK